MADSFFTGAAALAAGAFFTALAADFFATFAAGFFSAFVAVFAAALVDFLVGRAAADALAAVGFLAGARGEMASTPSTFTYAQYDAGMRLFQAFFVKQWR